MRGKEREVFNLLVGFAEGEAMGSRVVEHTNEAILDYVAPISAPSSPGRGPTRTIVPARLVNLPTMVMPEVGESDSRQTARVGHIENLTRAGSNYTFRFIQNTSIPEIAIDKIENAADALTIDGWEFKRTHWAVKDVDLYRVLQTQLAYPQPAPRVFQFPVDRPIEDDLIAVMMPFDLAFSAVYHTLQDAVKAAGLRCVRADTIWENHHIMDDILSLIWRARVIIADLSQKNPNVFYEAGIAHTLGRDVIQIAQSMEDVPFDLRSIRTLTYHNNGEGREELARGVKGRLGTLLG